MDELLQYLKDKVEGEALSIVTIKGGAAVDLIDRALSQCLQNINDINTTLDPREVNIKITLKPSEDRTYIDFGIKAVPRLAGQEGITGSADVRMDERGRAFGRERRSQQQALFGNVRNITKGGK